MADNNSDNQNATAWNEDKERRTLDRLTPDQRALYVSKHLMAAELALNGYIKNDIEVLRAAADTSELASGYLQTLQGTRLIEAGHMCLTAADANVFARPVPLDR